MAYETSRRKSPVLEEHPWECVCGWNTHKECEESRPQADGGGASSFSQPTLQACVLWCAECRLPKTEIKTCCEAGALTWEET